MREREREKEGNRMNTSKEKEYITRRGGWKGRMESQGREKRPGDDPGDDKIT